jgi:hypothetical protein
MIRKIAVVVFALFVLTPIVSFAQVTPGTQLTGTLSDLLDSGSAHAGDTFRILNVHSAENQIQGATIYGHVLNVTPAGQGRPAALPLSFDKILLANGDVYSMRGADTVRAQIITKSNAGKEAGSAAAGAAAGALIGHFLHQTLLGAVVGSGTAYALAKNNRANISYPKDSTIMVMVNRSLPREQAK